ncbi:MAG: hypothetical protein H0T79_23155 [Deltaproteobacteria bacterium]|nr:hypothetical protein [Deltaproteobacteria bacterium]
MRDVLEAHHDVLFGALAAFVRRPSRKTPDPAALEVSWSTGFAEEVRLQHAMGSALEDTYAALQRLPLAREIRKIVVGDPGAGPYGPTYRGLVNAMVASGTPPHLHTLVLGDVTAATRARIHAGDLRPLISAMTELETLDVGAGSGTLGPLVAPKLRRLAIAGLDPATVVASELPALVELDVRGAPAEILLSQLPRSALLGNLKKLAIVRCGLGDIELNSVLLFAAHYAHLEELDLRGNHFSRELVQEVGELVPHLKAGGRR